MNAPLHDIIIKIAEPAILPQVKRFFRDHHFRAQAPRGDEIHIALLGNRLIGALRLCPIDQAWLLRSMCVDAEYRHQGIGSMMLQQLSESIAERQCYCFPYEHLQAFYQHAGFALVSTDQAPAPIVEQYAGYRERGKKILLMKYQP